MATEFTIECSLQVAAGTYAAGAAELRGTQLVWRSAADASLSGERVVELQNVTGHQRNKPGSKVASLRLVVNNDNKVRLLRRPLYIGVCLSFSARLSEGAKY